MGATKEISTIPLVQEVFWAPAASVSQDELRMPLLDELLDLLDPSGREWNEKISSMWLMEMREWREWKCN